MTETAYQAVPAVSADEHAAHARTVVMKFGGTSVEGPERIKVVARRLADARGRAALEPSNRREHRPRAAFITVEAADDDEPQLRRGGVER